ncbi:MULTISPECIES: ketopantoate reductase family protein [Methylosinus]|uniref:2-dehydropantoate 2-reductase n=1 Tax=Methylosinus trichosporium (strain ATCC 35070 / NCIMB 11131 / UNIQEM 75 / OB3b) TaxID=595536 RepID=A0A2D2CVI8_METT3|nr:MULTISPECIES: ketopantoate reductase family protein [Methylosinus]ATQ66659.1 2-dehydropantoate 2-reductase [Methylosinus trichosporium OB3b]OBS51740.1 2-dehydropantoate 2-reductase [Methylosinus sp. 3S-1]
MRIAILGAGGVGGYYGGRLVEAGADVTFLLREARARLLAERGLVIESPLGDARLSVKTATRVDSPFDLVILACKAYDLDAALETIAGAVGPGTAILPLLNGLVHLDIVAERFPRAKVFGGVAQISSTLDENGVLHHFGERNRIIFGTRDGSRDARLAAVETAFANTPVEARHVDDIDRWMWEKFVLLAALAGITSLMRASLGDVLATPAGERLILQLRDECKRVARAEGWAPSPESEALLAVLTERGSSLKASMLRDIERGAPTEGEHILGDMHARAVRAGIETPILEIALTHVRAYEIGRRERA